MKKENWALGLSIVAMTIAIIATCIAAVSYTHLLRDQGIEIAYSTVCQYVRALEVAVSAPAKSPAEMCIRDRDMLDGIDYSLAGLNDFDLNMLGIGDLDFSINDDIWRKEDICLLYTSC